MRPFHFVYCIDDHFVDHYIAGMIFMAFDRNLIYFLIQDDIEQKK